MGGSGNLGVLLGTPTARSGAAHRSHGRMEGTLRLLELVRDKKLAAGHLRGLFHVCIGRVVSAADGTVVSAGVTWRELAALLKDAKYEKELVSELGADPDTLSPKDREKMWYQAVALAKVDSAAARAQADKLAAALKPHGFVVGPAPGGPSKLSNLAPPPPAPDDEEGEDDEAPAAKPKTKPKPKKKPKK